MSGKRDCNCASCVACTCSQHRCDVKAAQRSRQQRHELHYTPEQLTSVTAASYRPPTTEELRAASAVAGKPDWSAITKLHPNVKFEGTTTTQSTFRGEQNPRPSTSGGRPFFDRNLQDVGNGRGSTPFNATTAYSEQFVAPTRDASKAVPADRHLKSQFELHPRGAKFDPSTTNSREFRAYDLPRPQIVERPVSQPKPSIKFEGVSQTHADFQRKQRDPTQPIGHRHPEDRTHDYVPSGLRFEGETTTHDTYRGRQPPPSRQPAYEVPRAQRASLPFTGISQTHADFQRPPLVETKRNGLDLFRSHFQQPIDLYGGRPGQNSYETETHQQFVRKEIPVCPAQGWATPAETPPGLRTPNTW